MRFPPKDGLILCFAAAKLQPEFRAIPRRGSSDQGTGERAAQEVP